MNDDADINVWKQQKHAGRVFTWGGEHPNYGVMGIFIDCIDWNAFTVTDLDPKSSPGCPKKVTELSLHDLYAYATAEDTDRASRHGASAPEGRREAAGSADGRHSRHPSPASKAHGYHRNDLQRSPEVCRHLDATRRAFVAASLTVSCDGAL